MLLLLLMLNLMVVATVAFDDKQNSTKKKDIISSTRTEEENVQAVTKENDIWVDVEEEDMRARRMTHKPLLSRRTHKLASRRSTKYSSGIKEENRVQRWCRGWRIMEEGTGTQGGGEQRMMMVLRRRTTEHDTGRMTLVVQCWPCDTGF